MLRQIESQVGARVCDVCFKLLCSPWFTQLFFTYHTIAAVLQFCSKCIRPSSTYVLKVNNLFFICHCACMCTTSPCWHRHL